MSKKKEPTTTLKPELPPQFEVLDRETAAGVRGATQTVSITVNKQGNMRLSRMLSELLGLKSGAGIVFVFDKTADAWYLYRDDKNGLELRMDKNEMLQCNSSVVAKRLSHDYPDGVKSATMKVSDEVKRVSHLMLYEVMTSALKYRAPKD